MQYSEYGAAVLVIWMSAFSLIAHWLACLFFAIAIYERPTLYQKVGWIDALAERFQQRVFFSTEREDDIAADMLNPKFRNATASQTKLPILDIRSQYISIAN